MQWQIVSLHTLSKHFSSGGVGDGNKFPSQKLEMVMIIQIHWDKIYEQARDGTGRWHGM